MSRAVSLRRWQWLTVGLMVVGYAGYYLCRSNLSVTLLAIAEELRRTAWQKMSTRPRNN